jgi:hypothetical protein
VDRKIKDLGGIIINKKISNIHLNNNKNCLLKISWNKTPNSKKEEYMPKVKRITKLQSPEFTVDIEVENTHSYQLHNGWVSHNTVSQLVDAASGIHARHNEYYVRTVRGDNKDPLTQFMIQQGFPAEACVMKPTSTTIFSFPVKSPSGAVVRSDMTAIEQLEMWLIYQRHWCEHKPSVTITVKEHEWMDVGAFVYSHFDEMSGVSFLPHTDHVYKQAPYQDCSKDYYEELIAKMPKDIDWTELAKIEFEDMTSGSQTLACSSDGCELVDI